MHLAQAKITCTSSAAAFRSGILYAYSRRAYGPVDRNLHGFMQGRNPVLSPRVAANVQSYVRNIFF